MPFAKLIGASDWIPVPNHAVEQFNVLVFLSRTSDGPWKPCNKAVELDPGYSKAILAQVQAHTLNGDHAKALELANQGIQQHNNHVSYLVSKALALARLVIQGRNIRGVLNEVIEKSRQSPVQNRSSIALIHCHLDDQDTNIITGGSIGRKRK